MITRTPPAFRRHSTQDDRKFLQQCLQTHRGTTFFYYSIRAAQFNEYSISTDNRIQYVAATVRSGDGIEV